ncbi:MAG TPA: Ig-like domain-containing protein, partial [Candidatus Thermoplasmatota archaeon]|nr:Ig-like domain-containing protein [Candidatus Thermoplasmatota archaeon]
DGRPAVRLTTAGLTSTVRGLVELTGVAVDVHNRPITVEIQVNGGPWQRATGGEAWNFTWDTTAMPDGNYVIGIRASAGGLTSDVVEHMMTVRNTAARPPVQRVDDGNGIPAFEAGLALAALAGAVAVARRMRLKP